MYDRVEETRMRLSNSLIRYDGIPAMIEEVYLCDTYVRDHYGVDPDEEEVDYEDYYNIRTPQSAILIAVRRVGMQSITTNLADPLLDYTPVPLGFTVQPFGIRNPQYLWRATGRQYKQGLCNRVLNMERVSETSRQEADREIQIFSETMTETILGKYQPLTSVLDYLENEITPEAYQHQQVYPFSRDYALSVSPFGQLYLWHRTNRIALSDDGEVFRTLEQYMHLKEDLEEATKGVLKIASFNE